MEKCVTLSDCIDYSDSECILVHLTMSKNKEIQYKT